MNRRITQHRLIVLTFSVAICLTLYGPMAALGLDGDFDSDGQIGIGDTIAAIQIMTGGPVALPPRFTNTVGMTFVSIPAGEFAMGSPDTESGRQADESQHSVSFTKSIYMQTTEVTQGQWRSVMGSSPSQFSDCGDDCPVESVSWEDAQDFVDALNTLESTTAYRLPTEAEWEYAARAGTITSTSNGKLTELECEEDPVLVAIGWYCANAGERPHPVGRLKPNAWGFYDMHGNVWEWTVDGYRADLGAGPGSDPVEEETLEGRVYRGGGWSGDARTCRSADRDAAAAVIRAPDLGFRVVRTR